MATNPRSVQRGSQARPGGADPEPLDQGARATIESAIKSAIEQALVAEIAINPDAVKSFGRTFNKEGDSFSRIFSRNTPRMKEISVQDVAMMDDAAFAKFTERLKFLEEMGLAEPSRDS